MSDAVLPRTMTAWAQSRYGGPEEVRAETVELPTPGAGQVLLRVRAVGLNAGDVRVMRGDPRLIRLFFGLRRPRIAVRGMDVAGTVVAVGPGVTGLALGDEVVGELPGGGLAPFALAPSGRLVPRPIAVDAGAAAALPIAGGTAWQALERAGVVAGDRVLVIGASGGVGTFAVQLATDRGAEVWALCGARNRGLVEGLGATRVFDYRRVQPGAPELPAGSFDHVIDVAGTAPLGALQRLVRPGGSVVLVTGDGGSVLGPIPRILRAAVRSIGSRRRLHPLAATAKPDVLATLLQLVADGRVTPVIERTFPLGDARAALAHVDAGHTVGKVVVQPA
ncbi:NAD(P)-dependent alcohol dehydrogenase [Microbacterium caowuchunii]|uniref:NAD(P)-dependent alcohol dehydrogenase n=1 Tax=Microbacterium caowuchunii TaxID=2614638 RepID=A0A5N0TBV8_9MICO|nr:NAD(P)-dependent alcohol dehydrogenase [Microbacterium caowuchunii]KAA9132231.1 NAD(P)-dependent alcohol dehydrogenase [Microbacterium caowuchunii]